MSERDVPIVDRVPMRYRDLVPNFRCSKYGGKAVIEVPPNYGSMPDGKPTTADGPDAEAHKMLRRLIHESVPAPVFDEVRAEEAEAAGVPGGHRLTILGVRIPKDRFDMIMGQAVPGRFWACRQESGE